MRQHNRDAYHDFGEFPLDQSPNAHDLSREDSGCLGSRRSWSSMEVWHEELELAVGVLIPGSCVLLWLQTL